MFPQKILDDDDDDDEDEDSVIKPTETMGTNE